MSKISRLSGIPNVFEMPALVAVNPCCDVVFGESVADKSYFRPDYAIVRAATGSSTLGAPSPEYYAFPDGKDTGADMPLAYRRGVDLAELSQEIYTKDQMLSDALNKAIKQDARTRQRQQDVLQQQMQQQVQQSSLQQPSLQRDGVNT